MKAAFRLAMAASMSTSLESDQNINLGANNKGKFPKFPTRDEINVKFAATVDKIQNIDEFNLIYNVLSAVKMPRLPKGEDG